MDNTGGGSNTFYVKVNGNTYTWEIVLNNGYNPPEFVKDGNNVNAAPVNVTLSGTVSIVLAVREDGAKIDKLALVPVDVEPQNQPPTADAGADQTVTAANTNNAAQVTLDGTGSTDTDGTVVSYAWSANGGAFATEATPTYVFGVGTTEVTLTVTDDDGATATDTVSITVTPFVRITSCQLRMPGPTRRWRTPTVTASRRSRWTALAAPTATEASSATGGAQPGSPSLTARCRARTSQSGRRRSH